MNNYRTNCNNRRVMPGCTQSMQNMQNMQNNRVQRMDTMQDNCRNRVCNDIQSNQNCNCDCNEVQNDQNCDCICNEMQMNQNCNCTCNEVQGNQDMNCGCDTIPEHSACRPEPTLDKFPIGMAYVPIQQWCRLYDMCAAFRNGTLFQELNLDFLGRRCS